MFHSFYCHTERGFMATWKQLKPIMTHFRLFAEWEQTCEMRGGGGLRHHHSARQTRIRYVRRHLQNYFIGVVKPIFLLSIHWRPVSKGQCQCRGLDGKETLCLDANHLWMTEESANVGVSERSDNIDPWPLIMISECHHTCFIFSRDPAPPLDMRTSLQHQHNHRSSSKLSSDTNDFSWKWSVFKGVLHCSRFK